MLVPTNQEEFRQFFQSGSAVVSLEEADAIVASLSDIELTDCEVRTKFWREFRPLTIVSRLLGSETSFKYTGLTNQQFDAVLFNSGGSEHIVECTSIDRMGKYYQKELIERIKNDDGSWNPQRIVLKRRKYGEEHYCVIDEKEIPDVETDIVGACLSLLEQFYKKLCSENRIREGGQRLLQNKIDYYIFCSYEPPFGLIMFDDCKRSILRQLQLLSSITSRRLFFVGRDHVIDSEMKQ